MYIYIYIYIYTYVYMLSGSKTSVAMWARQMNQNIQKQQGFNVSFGSPDIHVWIINN